jgi:glycosyltransferase involved in cell wall biosynthesis
MKPKGVSVIICCYNAAQRITPVLEALQRQRFTAAPSAWEVIVIDNASSDETANVSAEVWKRNPVTAFKTVREDRPGLMYARKRGISEAAFDIVSFIDDDNRVEDRWVEKLIEVFSSDESIGACGGSSKAVFEDECPGWFAQFENNYAVGRQMEKSGFIDAHKGYLWGAGLSFRKSLWQELQQRGFKNLTVGREGKNITAGEDSELCYAFRLLGYKLYYRDDLSLEHYMPQTRMNFSYLLKMATGFGQAYARLNCYRVLLYPGFALHPWWYEWAATVKNQLRLTIRSLFAPGKKEKRDIAFRKAYNEGYARQVWRDKSGRDRSLDLLKKIFAK